MPARASRARSRRCGWPGGLAKRLNPAGHHALLHCGPAVGYADAPDPLRGW